MTGAIVLPITGEVLVSSYAECQAALLNRDLSRTFDDRPYEEGNVRHGNVATLHGPEHRERRRLENPLFRSDKLKLFERDLFPDVMERLLGRLVASGEADLLILAEMLSVVLSAERAGIDHNPEDPVQMERLVDFINTFSAGSAIIDVVGDADTIRAQVMAAMATWEPEFLAPSRARREALVERFRAGAIDESQLPSDVLTLMLLHRDDADLGFTDGVIARETATYLHGGTHTSSQTLTNTVDMLLPLAGEDPPLWKRVATDRLFAQACIHETLRLRPTTPRLKRRAASDTRLGDREIGEGTLVLIDVGAANRDPSVYGDDADTFDPHRTVAEKAARWGLTFGAGAHQCPGRNVAVGLPLPSGPLDAEVHLYGLATLMLQAIARLEPSADPDTPPQRDERTVRKTRWRSYPVRFASTAVRS